MIHLMWVECEHVDAITNNLHRYDLTEWFQLPEPLCKYRTVHLYRFGTIVKHAEIR